jgi:UDP-N-acetylmuramoylalanine--D-glutamate ligase
MAAGSEFSGQRVTVMGLGTRGGGLGVSRYLAESGAIVTVTDMRPESDLAEPIEALCDLPIRFVLGRHDDSDFTPEGADIVVRNPGVRRTSRHLRLARESGVRIEMEMSIFLRACPAPVIGITGTKGKTTTASLCAEMLRHWRPETVLAGNMGVSAVAELEGITPETPVVLELSSWQLEALDEHQLAPAIAVLTNISEDHLDAYDGFEDYAATKRSIARHQRDNDWLVVKADDPVAFRATDGTAAHIVPFGTTVRSEPAMAVDPDLHRLIWRRDGRTAEIQVPNRMPFLGCHQLMNVAGAAAAALLRGAPVETVVDGLRSFNGVYNRMEVIAEIDDVTFINDTAATAPAATIANLDGLRGRHVHLIAGGHDKQSDFTALAASIASSVCTVHLLAGTATPTLKQLIEQRGKRVVDIHDSMASAVRSASHAALPNDIVLLSPGCASFGLFRDEFDRGDQFRAAVAALQLQGRLAG